MLQEQQPEQQVSTLDSQAYLSNRHLLKALQEVSHQLQQQQGEGTVHMMHKMKIGLRDSTRHARCHAARGEVGCSCIQFYHLITSVCGGKNCHWSEVREEVGLREE